MGTSTSTDHEQTEDCNFNQCCSTNVTNAGNDSKKSKKTVSFDEGFVRNVVSFWKGDLKEEWLRPIPCVFKDSDTDESD